VLKNVIYTEQLAELMASRLNTPRPRQFGFEYEFMPGRPLNPVDLSGVQRILEEMGYKEEPGLFRAPDHYVTFEPGGQIEFCSIPILPSDEDTVLSILSRAESVIGEVGNRLGFIYIPTGYIPGRGSAPMLLDKPRYHNLHRLLGKTGTRGHEMMKGTAAIHFHVALLSLEELPRVWATVCELSQSQGFAMGLQRRDIWDNTDPSRCGLLCRGEKIPSTDHREFLRRVVDFGMGALDLATGLPFGELPDRSFPEFLDHLTTLFTDVRINMKGITLELRTLDSRPSGLFLEKWRQFLDRMRQCSEGWQVD
jgi:glutamate--cysteine ligase